MSNVKEEHCMPSKRMVLIGKGVVTVTPDLALIRIGVQTTGDNVTTAQAENAKINQQVLDAIKKLGVNDIKTYQYQIEKVYDYENGTRVDRGYSVRNIYEIHTTNVGQTGFIIDTAVYNGANVVDLISFDVASLDKYYQQALSLAVNNAYQKAKTIASGLRIMFDSIPILITENSVPPSPYNPVYAFRGEIASPIESGNKQIEATVTVEFAY